MSNFLTVPFRGISIRFSVSRFPSFSFLFSKILQTAKLAAKFRLRNQKRHAVGNFFELRGSFQYLYLSGKRSPKTF